MSLRGEAVQLITVFALGMIVGAPLMAMLTLRLPSRVTLMAALGVFAAGHVVVALGSSFALLLAARFLTALATGAFWAVASVVAARVTGPGATSRALGVVGAGAMLANVAGVPLGAFAGQAMGWRAPFWVLAVLAVAMIALMARYVPHDGPDRRVRIRSELSALRSGRLWLALAACATTTGGVLSAYSYIAPLLTGRAGIAAGLVPLVLVGFGIGALAGTLLGGRLGDARPHATTITAAAVTTVILLAIVLLSTHAGWAMSGVPCGQRHRLQPDTWLTVRGDGESIRCMLEGGRVRAAQRDATRARLVAAAVETLIVHGYAGLSTVAVQRAAGASRGALLHHFPARGALVEALVGELVSRNEAVVEAALTAAPAGGPDVERAVGTLHQALASDSFQAELELWAVARTDAEVRAALAAAERRSRRDLGRVVDAAFGTAVTRPGYRLVAELRRLRP